MSVGIIGGNVRGLHMAGLTLSPASVAANTTAEQTFTVPGLRLARHIIASVNKPTSQAGLGICNYRVSADDTIAITFSNNTASPIVPTASELYRIMVAALENNTWPTSVLGF